MPASNSQGVNLPIRSARVAADFMMLAGASAIAGLGVAAIAAAVVILITAT